MNIRVNDEPRELDRDMTVAELLERLGHAPGSVAVAVNREFVPRSEHVRAPVRAGDEVDIVSPRQGG